MGYDANGNRTSYGASDAVGDPARMVRYGYRFDDALASTTVGNDSSTTKTSQFDVYGAVVSDGCASYRYDGFARLTSSTTLGGVGCPTRGSVSYGYDGLDRQVSGTETGSATAGVTSTWFDGLSGSVLAEGNPDASVTRYALSPGGVPVAVTRSGAAGGVQFESPDGFGVVSTATTSSGVLACQRRYDPYGNPVSVAAGQGASGCTNPGGSALGTVGYANARRDGATGTYQLGARTYDPARAGFLTPDTAGTGSVAGPLSVGVDPLTRNTYTYVNGDPVNYLDPSGHRPCTFHRTGQSWDRRVCQANYSDYWFVESNQRVTDRNRDLNARCSGGNPALARVCAANDDYFQHSYSFDDVAKYQAPRKKGGFWKHALAIGAGIAAGVGCGVAAVALTGGTAVVACGAVAGAVTGAIYGAFDCDGSAGCIIESTVTGAASGAVFAGVGGVVGKAIGGAIARAASSRIGAAIASRASAALSPIRTAVSNGLSRASSALRGIPQAAEGAEGAASTGLRDAAESCLNSFTAGTPVLMADGKEKPIADVKVGDKVLATYPETGKTEARPVVALIRHSGKHRMVDMTLSDGSKITTTDHHPFWDASTRMFMDAIDLHIGDRVLSDGGRTLTITGEHVYDRDLTAYNLQIDGIHTYYAGNTPVLVHNSCNISNPSSFGGATRSEAEQELANSGWYNAGPTSGDGVRWRLPNNPSDQVRIMRGNPADPNPVKQGPYIRFSISGTKYGPFSLLDF